MVCSIWPVLWVYCLEAIPVIAKDLLEGILVDMIHSASMGHYTANTFSIGVIILAGLIYEKVPGVAGLSSFHRERSSFLRPLKKLFFCVDAALSNLDNVISIESLKWRV